MKTTGEAETEVEAKYSEDMADYCNNNDRSRSRKKDNRITKEKVLIWQQNEEERNPNGI